MKNFKKRIAMIIVIAMLALTLVSCDMSSIMSEILQDVDVEGEIESYIEKNSRDEESEDEDDDREETSSKKSWSDIFGNKQPSEEASTIEYATVAPPEFGSSDIYYPEYEEWPYEPEGELEYSFYSDAEGDYCSIVNIGSWRGKYLEIPYEIDGFVVKRIEYAAFMGAYGIETLIIPEGVEEIEMWAFGYCENLREIQLPSTLKYISPRVFTYSNNVKAVWMNDTMDSRYMVVDNCIIDREANALHTAFNNSNIEYVLYDCNITVIGDDACRGVTALDYIKIPSSVEQIGSCAFYDCTNLTRIDIASENLYYIGSSAFAFCYSLKGMYVVEGNPYYYSMGDCIIEYSTGRLVLGCANSNIPDDGSITIIGQAAFAGCTRLREITIPSSVKIIEREAFYSCSNLKSVYMYEGVEEIQYCAFADTINLYDITIPESAIYIDSEAFVGNPVMDPNYDSGSYPGYDEESGKIEFSTSIIINGSYGEIFTGDYIEIGSGNGYFEIVTGGSGNGYEIVTDEYGNVYYYYYTTKP